MPAGGGLKWTLDRGREEDIEIDKVCIWQAARLSWPLSQGKGLARDEVQYIT